LSRLCHPRERHHYIQRLQRMRFLRLFFMGFLLFGKQRLFTLLVCFMLAVFLDMYDFSHSHFFSALALWTSGICLFYFINLTFLSAMSLLNLIGILTWCFTHFNDTISFHLQDIMIGLMAIWIVETIMNLRR